MSVKLFACGDYVNYTGKSDFLDDKMRDVIQSCDVAVCNFEAPIKHENMVPIPKACLLYTSPSPRD
jgi:hypothetical protein